jgi:hypothetical protein
MHDKKNKKKKNICEKLVNNDREVITICMAVPKATRLFFFWHMIKEISLTSKLCKG